MGIDWDGPLPPIDGSENTVFVDPPEPLISIIKSFAQQLILLILVKYGLELYIETLQFVRQAP